MRLLNAKTLEFDDIMNDSEIPRYAILSHTWGPEEVTYKDMRKNRKAAEAKEGFKKIDRCAKEATKYGIEYIWVDTCCINKASSAELSEAINSMYRWYKNANVCYTYLADVPPVPGSKDQYEKWIGEFKKSRWFTRGWTLQELIAPSHLIFYSEKWTKVGTKVELANPIKNITGVPLGILVNGNISDASVAQRLSWAAHRETSRTEDRAYCLLGLLDVNMPMLYGEGQKAFLRLQEEIIKNSDDMSIFAWTDPNASFSSYRGLLARSPKEFGSCHDMRWFRMKAKLPPYQSTNKGVRLESRLVPYKNSTDEVLTPLWGVMCGSKQATLGIILRKVGEDQYARIETDKVTEYAGGKWTSPQGEMRPFYVRPTIEMEAPEHSRAGGILMQTNNTRSIILEKVEPSGQWNKATKFFSFESPIATTKPPVVTFSMKLKKPGAKGGKDEAGKEEKLTVLVDAGKRWGTFAVVQFASQGWNTKEHLNPSRQVIICQKKGELEIEVLAVRGLVDEESKIILSVNTHRAPANSG